MNVGTVENLRFDTGESHATNCGCIACRTAEKDDNGVTTPPEGDVTGYNIGTTAGTASSISVGQTISGINQVIDYSGDEDWYAISLTAGQSIQVNLTGLGLADPLLRMFNASGQELAFNDDIDYPNNPNSQLTFMANSSGTYYISAEAFSNFTGSYQLSVVEVEVTWENSPEFDSPLLDAMSWGQQFDHTNLTVYFGAAGYTADGVTSEGFSAWEQQQFMAAFAAIEAISGLTFTIVNSGVDADMELILDTNELSSGLYGSFNPPGYGDDGVGHFNGNLWDRFSGGDLTEGGFGYFTIMHELLHGLGLSHPHDTGGDSSILPGVGSSLDDFGDFDLNQGIFTMMSYNPGYHTGTPGSAPAAGTGDGAGTNYSYAAGPMAVDIAILQALYGANTSYASGADTYFLPTGTGAGTYWSTIWDAGGIDSIRHSGAGAVQIDLRAATLEMESGGGGFVSAVNGTRGGFTIANGVVIENAFGGSSNDYIIGNNVGNMLVGFGGFDTIVGGGGNDTIDGGNGADSLYGGIGNDEIIGADGFDQLYGDSGNDTLRGGSTADRLYGDDDDDVLFGGSNFGITVDGLWGGNGNDTLYGEGGFDLLDGGAGNDYLDGGHQADNLYGRSGDDTLLGGDGLDRLFGGADDDLAIGGAGNDGLFGEQGNDTLRGGTGHDRFFGGTGNDQILGEQDNDTIYAGAGFDTITGGVGDDVLQGDFNADTFVFIDGHGNDTITDFAATNQFERIDLSAIAAITDLNDLMNNHISTSGANVIINTGAGQQITLLNVNSADLDSSDFIF